MPLGSPNVLILRSHALFRPDWRDQLVDELRRALLQRGCAVDLVRVPVAQTAGEATIRHLVFWRTLELRAVSGKKVDLLIATDFPAFVATHSAKVLWLLSAYGPQRIVGEAQSDALRHEAIRRMLHFAEHQALAECQEIFALTPDLQRYLQRVHGVSSRLVFPPLPFGGEYRALSPEKYVLVKAGKSGFRGLDMVLRGLAEATCPLQLKVVGRSDDPTMATFVRSEVDRLHLWPRVEFLGERSDDELVSLFSRSFAVLTLLQDEEVDYSTLAAFACSKPVIGCRLSRSMSTFVTNEVDGLVVEANPQALCRVFERLWTDGELYQRLQRATISRIFWPSWEAIADEFLGTLYAEKHRERASCLGENASHCTVEPGYDYMDEQSVARGGIGDEVSSM